MGTKVRWVKPVHLSMQKADIMLQTTDLIPDWVRDIVVGAHA